MNIEVYISKKQENGKRKVQAVINKNRLAFMYLYGKEGLVKLLDKGRAELVRNILEQMDAEHLYHAKAGHFKDENGMLKINVELLFHRIVDVLEFETEAEIGDILDAFRELKKFHDEIIKLTQPQPLDKMAIIE